MHSSVPASLVIPVNNLDNVKIAWFIVQIIGGQVLLPMVLLTMALSRNVRRDPTLVNFVVTWIAFTVFTCMLFYGGAFRGPEPSLGLCVSQAALLYGAAPMLNVSTLALVIQIWLWLRTITYDKTRDPEHVKIRTDILVIAPYVVFLIMSVSAAIIGAQHPEIVSRQRRLFYCSLDSHIDIVAGFICILTSCGTIIFECLAAAMLSRQWSSTITDLRLPHTRLAFNVRLIKRLVIFSLFAILAYLTAIFQVGHPMLQYIWFFTSALLPIGVFLIFGTQASILRVWAIWIPRKPRSETDTLYSNNILHLSCPPQADEKPGLGLEL